jgi:hypothetical protein
MYNIIGMLMRSIITVVIAFLLGLGTLIAQNVTFSSIPHKSGESFGEESHMEMNMVLHVDAQGQNMDFDVANKDSYNRTVSILEMFGYDISLFTVNYSEFSSEAKAPQGETVVKGPVVGRTYKIYRADTVKTVEAEDQKPLSNEELTHLKQEFKKADFSERMNKILDGKTLAIGDTLALSKDLAMNFFGKGAPSDVRDFTIKLKSTRQINGMQCAVFGARIVLDGESGQLTMRFMLEGDILIGVRNCWPIEMRLTGPINVQGEQEGIMITGEGTMTGEKKFSYVK